MWPDGGGFSRMISRRFRAGDASVAIDCTSQQNLPESKCID